MNLPKVNFGWGWEKFVTVVLDRRLWAVLLTVVPLVFGFPALAEEHIDQLSGEAVAIATLLVQSLAILFGGMGLLNSWTKRPPSGKNFKNVQTSEDELLSALRNVLNVVNTAK